MFVQGQNFKDIPTGIHRFIEEQIRSAYAFLLNMHSKNLDETIHELRKSFKKVRAAYRLIKPLIGKEAYQKENNFYRDLGREVSVLRDQTAIIEGLQQLIALHQQALEPGIFKLTMKSLHKTKKNLKHEFKERDKAGYLKIMLHDKQHQLPASKWNIQSNAQITSGLKKTYKKGMLALSISRATKATEHLHEWRKQVKYLRYQFEILSWVRPGTDTSFEAELHHLSNLLGTDHDFSNIQKQIDDNMVEFESAPEKALLTALIKYHREQLQRKALSKGEVIYQQKPAIFMKDTVAKLIDKPPT